MSKAFARQTKLPNIVGRSDYISDTTRQEHIVYYSNEYMVSDWQEYADFEKQNRKNKQENIQGREIIIALPNELDQDLMSLKDIVDEYAINTVGKDREFEYAVHWNKDKTNLHAHIIYSERKRETEQKAKTYRSDMWFNKSTGKLAKANSDNAELRFKKGEVQKDKKGNVRYENNMFTTKERVFKSNDFNDKLKDNLAEVLNKHGYQSRVFDRLIELPQAKLYKGASNDYIKKATESNLVRAEYNKIVVEAVKEKIMPKTIAILNKENIMKKVKEENSKSQSISRSGIEYIRESINKMKEYIKGKLESIKNVMEYQKEKNKEVKLHKKPQLPSVELKIKEMEKNTSQANQERFKEIESNENIINALKVKIKNKSKKSFADEEVMSIAKKIDNLNMPIKDYKNKIKKIKKIKIELKRVEEGYKKLKFYEIHKEKPLLEENTKLSHLLRELEEKIEGININKLQDSKKRLNKILKKLNEEREEINRENKEDRQLIYELEEENIIFNDEITEENKLLRENIFDIRNPEVVEQRRQKEAEIIVNKEASKITAQFIIEQLERATPYKVSSKLTKSIQGDVFEQLSSNKDFNVKEFLNEFSKQSDPNELTFTYKSSTSGFKNSNYAFEEEVKRQRQLQRSRSIQR